MIKKDSIYLTPNEVADLITKILSPIEVAIPLRMPGRFPNEGLMLANRWIDKEIIYTWRAALDPLLMPLRSKK